MREQNGNVQPEKPDEKVEKPFDKETKGHMYHESVRRVKTAHANRTQIHHTLYLSHKVTL